MHSIKRSRLHYETVQEIPVWSRTVFYPEFGVLVRRSERGPRRTLALQVRSSEKEHGRTQVWSLDSELGERTGPNPGSAGSENLPNSEPAKPGLYPVLSLNFEPPNQG